MGFSIAFDPARLHYALGNEDAETAMKGLVFFLCGLLIAPSARSDERTARALAERIVDLAVHPEVLQNYRSTTFERLQKELVSRGLPAAGVDELRKAMDDWFTQNFDPKKIRSSAADFYVQEFTEDELRQMLAFYETPVGQKALKKMPLLGLKVSNMAEKSAAEKNGALRAALKPILQKYGMTNSPTPSVQRTEASRSDNETNRTSSAAGPRR